MPWEIKSAGSGRYNVVKQSDGKVVGRNLPKKRASAMLRALYANVKEPVKNALVFLAAAAGYPKGVDMKVAKKVDLIVLPRSVEGTNCGNCKWKRGTGDKMRCDNPEVEQSVTDRLCCFLPSNEIQAEGKWDGASKALYSGPAVEIKTTTGNRLALTINHPVLTENGFVAAGQLREGCNLVTNRSGTKRSLNIDNIKNTPITAEQVFNSLLSLDVSFAQVKPTSVDFHGDAMCFKGDIDVIRTHSQLMNRRQVSSAEFRKNFQFSKACPGFDPLKCSCSGELLMFGDGFTLFGLSGGFSLFGSQFGIKSNLLPDNEGTVLTTPTDTFNRFGANGQGSKPVVCNTLSSLLVPSFPCPFDDDAHFFAESPSFLDGFFGSSDLLSFECCSDRDFIIDQNLADLPSISLEAFGDRSNRLARDVSFDQVVDASYFHYEGPVYDFQTTTGFIVACGIKVSNCALWDRTDIKRPWGKQAKL